MKTLDNTRKSWFTVHLDGKRIGGFGEMTEQQAWDRALQKYGHLGSITIKEHDPEKVNLMREKLQQAIRNGGSSFKE